MVADENVFWSSLGIPVELPVWPLYIAASSKFAPGIAIKSFTAANGYKGCVNFILDDKILQYCHVFMLPRFKAYIRVSNMCVCCQLYILAANGQTWHEYALTAVNSPMRLIKELNIVALFKTLTTKRLDIVFLIFFTLFYSIFSADLTRKH